MLDILERLNELKKTSRIGWLECGFSLVEAEDVAQHSFETVVITMLLADRLKEVDRERALVLAIIHDWAEALIGDISPEISSQISEEIKGWIGRKAMEDLIRNLSGGERYLELWEEYSKGRTKESRLVHAADKLSILVEANWWLQRGKRSKGLNKLWREVRKGTEEYVEEFPVVGELLRELDETSSA